MYWNLVDGWERTRNRGKEREKQRKWRQSRIWISTEHDREEAMHEPPELLNSNIKEAAECEISLQLFGRVSVKTKKRVEVGWRCSLWQDKQHLRHKISWKSFEKFKKSKKSSALIILFCFLNLHLLTFPPLPLIPLFRSTKSSYASISLRVVRPPLLL